ncbi:MAG TPA: metal ABC transporter permease [Bacillota bacterium]
MIDGSFQLPAPLALEFMQRAYLAGLVAALAAPAIGTFLVLRRLALLADGLGHIAFAGVAGGLLFGVQPLVGALAAALVGSLSIERLRAAGRTPGDAAIGIYASIGLGAGLVLARLAGAGNIDLFGFLFGTLVAVQPRDLLWLAVLGAVVLAALAAFYKELLVLVIDEEAALAAGLPVTRLNQGLAALAALTVIIAMRVVGVLLVAALMVLPVAAALQLARGLGRTLLYAMAFGAFSVVSGLTLAYYLDVPAGAAIVLTCAAVFGVVNVASGRRVSKATGAGP